MTAVSRLCTRAALTPQHDWRRSTVTAGCSRQDRAAAPEADPAARKRVGPGEHIDHRLLLLSAHEMHARDALLHEVQSPWPAPFASFTPGPPDGDSHLHPPRTPHNTIRGDGTGHLSPLRGREQVCLPIDQPK